MRRLIYIPIIHGPEDFGTQLDAVRSAYVSRYGIRAWQQHLKAIEQFWRELRRAVRSLPVKGSALRIYQDGLPVCGRELDVVRQLAAQGSQNHRLLVGLVQEGALLMGTEDPELLRREQERSRGAAALGERASRGRYDELMERRDRYIAGRIDATLQGEGVVGLLFMGALHRVTEYLSKDIEVVPWPKQ